MWSLRSPWPDPCSWSQDEALARADAIGAGWTPLVPVDHQTPDGSTSFRPQTQLYVDTPPSIEHIKSGKVRALAVTGDLSAAGARAQCRAAVARARGGFFGLCYAAANRRHWNNPDGLR